MHRNLLAFVFAAGACGCSQDGSNGPVHDWPTCEHLSGTTPLAAKAAAFDRVARDRHLAGDGLLRNLVLTEDLQEVESWHHVENTILWSGIYLASQAFRYAVTGETEAVENARTVLGGLHELTRVTGVRGLYGRSMDDPEVNYNYDGRGTTSWTESTAAGYEGWAFRNDVSKDGYAGLMFGYAAAMEHFDDASILADVRERIREVADHIVSNGLQIIDTDGEVTEHGALYHTAWDDFPGFNAMLAASWIKIAQTALDDEDLDDFYYGCLMETRRGVECPDIETTELGTYMDSMEEYLYLFLPGCKQNYDNFDMCYQAIYPLLRREQHADLRPRLLQVLRGNMFHTENPDHQSVAEIGNAWYTFAYAALAGDGPEDDPVLEQAVDLAVCTLKEFPEEKHDRYIPAGTQEEVCRSRLDNPVAAEPIPLAEYHFDNYLWRLDFFEIQPEHPGNTRLIWSPEDFLMVYWLGRYHGLLGPEL